MLVVLRQPNYALLWAAALVSGIGNFVLLAALPYFVYATSGSVLASRATFGSQMAPMVMPTVGRIFADRWKRKPVMVASDWLRGLILVPLLAVHGASTLWIVYLTTFLGAIVGTFAGPFGNAAIPHVVDERALPAANATFSVGGNVAVLVGYALGGLIMSQVGFALSGLFVCLVSVAPPERVGARPGLRAEGALGLADLRRHDRDVSRQRHTLDRDAGLWEGNAWRQRPVL